MIDVLIKRRVDHLRDPQIATMVIRVHSAPRERESLSITYANGVVDRVKVLEVEYLVDVSEEAPTLVIWVSPLQKYRNASEENLYTYMASMDQVWLFESVPYKNLEHRRNVGIHAPASGSIGSNRMGLVNEKDAMKAYAQRMDVKEQQQLPDPEDDGPRYEEVDI